MRISHTRISAASDVCITGFVPRALIAISLCLLVAMAASAADETPFPGLRALMDDEQFERSGLDKLSPKERAALNRWLATHADFELSALEKPKEHADQEKEPPQGAPAAEPAPPRKVVAKRIDRKKRAAREVIRTRIAGKFTGWTGSTIFSLENGQLWRQRQSGRYRYKAESPEVELFQNRLGLWEMRILATGKRVKVSRYRQ